MSTRNIPGDEAWPAFKADNFTAICKEEISHHSTQYSKHLSTHPNELALNFQEPIATTPANRSEHQIQ
jgi:hypothetical protein